MNRDEALQGLVDAAANLAGEAQGSVEYGDWPELQKCIEKVFSAIERLGMEPTNETEE